MDLPQAWPPFVFLATDYAPCNRLVFLILGAGSVATTNPMSVSLSDRQASPPVCSIVGTRLVSLSLSLSSKAWPWVCSLTSCGAYGLQFLGTLECFSLRLAGVALLSSELFSANVYTYVFVRVHVCSGPCLCTTCANKGYHWKPGW